jgi:hypothetical protein
MPLWILPDYRHANPFQTLLYAGLPDVRAWRPAEGAGGVLHVQWEDVLFRDAGDEEAAGRKVAGALALLDAHRARGGKLAWTLHNRTSHTCPHKRAERAFRAGLLERADAIHLLDERHRAVLAEIGARPRALARATVIPHPSYAAHYGRLERGAARALVRASDRPLFFHFGAPRAARAWAVLQGPTIENPAVDKVFSIPGSTREVDSPALRIAARRLSDVELAVYGSAADFSIFADGDALNSGTLAFYLSYGLRVFVERQALRWMSLPGYPEELLFDGSLEASRVNAVLADEGVRARFGTFLAGWQAAADPGAVAARFRALVDGLAAT